MRQVKFIIVFASKESESKGSINCNLNLTSVNIHKLSVMFLEFWK